MYNAHETIINLTYAETNDDKIKLAFSSAFACYSLARTHAQHTSTNTRTHKSKNINKNQKTLI